MAKKTELRRGFWRPCSFSLFPGFLFCFLFPFFLPAFFVYSLHCLQSSLRCFLVLLVFYLLPILLPSFLPSFLALPPFLPSFLPSCLCSCSFNFFLMFAYFFDPPKVVFWSSEISFWHLSCKICRELHGNHHSSTNSKMNDFFLGLKTVFFFES